MATTADDAVQRQKQAQDIQRDLDKLVGQMQQKVEKVAEKGERISLLVERADDLEIPSQSFYQLRGNNRRRPPPTQEMKQQARANPRWIEDKAAPYCMLCKQVEFWRTGPASWTRHHCRSCGWVVCLNCCPADQTALLGRWVSSTAGHPIKEGAPPKAKRVCNSCKEHVISV
jgi:hypothetical protein